MTDYQKTIASLRDALAQARECITALADELDSYTLEGSFRDDADAALATIDAVTADTRMEGGDG